MTNQLLLIDSRPAWRLDRATRAQGLEGVANARAVLRAAPPALALLPLRVGAAPGPYTRSSPNRHSVLSHHHCGSLHPLRTRAVRLRGQATQRRHTDLLLP